MLKIYGLKNCDTCRKALKWLQAEDIAHEFVDLRAGDGMAHSEITAAMGDVGAEKLVNRRGTTWRQLTDADKAKTGDALIDLLAAQPAIMKRPIFQKADGYFVGFDKAAQERLSQ